MAHDESIIRLPFSPSVDVSGHDEAGHYSTNLIHYTINVSFAGGLAWLCDPMLHVFPMSFFRFFLFFFFPFLLLRYVCLMI
jgi:hypothetical protein